jgi:hypothetical protein
MTSIFPLYVRIASQYLPSTGEAEQIRTEWGKEKIYLKSRKGFVKLAMEEGAHLVPIYVFGETSLYKVP